VVLDPFCGCGAAVDAAEKLKRQWIGIDITHLAINLIKSRLHDTHGLVNGEHYTVTGEPTCLSDAEHLAADDPWQFQWWALGLVAARPRDQKKGADRGIDGRLYFHEGDNGKTKQIVISVKAGKTSAPHVRDLRGVVEREKAAIGVLITMQEPTSAMRKEAASAGYYTSAWGKHPKIQLLTIEELLDGKRIDYPRTIGSNVSFKQAPKWRRKRAEQIDLDEMPAAAASTRKLTVAPDQKPIAASRGLAAPRKGPKKASPAPKKRKRSA
jgi:hypothetical protein